MIDIIIVKSNDKNYSAKCSLTFTNDERGKVATVKILNVELIDSIDGSSYRKLKTIFTAGSVSSLRNIGYSDLYNEITKKLIQKYRMNVLNIWKTLFI